MNKNTKRKYCYFNKNIYEYSQTNKYNKNNKK